MPIGLNNWFKAFLSLNKSEQRGIIILILVSLIILATNFLLPYIIDSETESNVDKYRSEIEAFIEEQQSLTDSINLEKLQNTGEIDSTGAKQKIHPVKFNPNKLPVKVWKKMGFTDKQISNIKNYEAKGGKFKRKEDLKKIYSISDAEYAILEPYIIIPSSNKTDDRNVSKKKKEIIKVNYSNIEINSADSSGLVVSLGLSPRLAKRTISYRNILGGYIYKEQLKEVYGLNASIYNMINKYISVDTGLIKKININDIEFIELLKHPYFDYNTTKLIIETRNKIGTFSSITQLELMESINDTTINKIRDYLYFRPLK